MIIHQKVHDYIYMIMSKSSQDTMLESDFIFGYKASMNIKELVDPLNFALAVTIVTHGLVKRYKVDDEWSYTGYTGLSSSYYDNPDSD